MSFNKSNSDNIYGTPTPSGKEAFVALYGNNMLKRQDIEENTGLQMKYAYHLNDLLKKEFSMKCQPENTNDDEKFICKIIKDKRWSDCFEDTKMIGDKWKCYICGGLINKDSYEMEIEHLLPFSFAAQYGMLVKKNTTSSIIKHGKLQSDHTYVDDPEYPELKKINIHQGSLKMVNKKPGEDLKITYTTESKEKKEIIIKDNEILLNPYQLLLSCLEMRPSHKCCNQIKSNALFIERDTKNNNKYIVRTEYIKNYLKTIIKTANKSGYKEDWFCDNGKDRISSSLNVNDRTKHLEKYFGLMCDILNEYERKQFYHLFGKDGELNSDELRKAASLNIMVQLASFDAYLKPDQFDQVMKSSPTLFTQEELEEHVYIYLKEKNIKLCKTQPKRKNEEEREYYSKSFMTCFRENKLFDELARNFFDETKITEYIQGVNPGKRLPRNIVQEFVQIFAPSLFKNNNLWELILKYYCRVFSQRTTINAGTLDFQDSISSSGGIDLVKICMIFIIYFAKKNNLCKDKISKEIELVSLTPYLTPGKDSKVKVKDVGDFDRLENELREIFGIALDKHIEQAIIEEQRTEIFKVIDEALSKNALEDLVEATLTDPLADLKEFVKNYKLQEEPQIYNPPRSIMSGRTYTRENELPDYNSDNNNDFFNPQPSSVFRRNYTNTEYNTNSSTGSKRSRRNYTNTEYNSNNSSTGSTGSKRSRSNRNNNNNNNRITKRRGGYGGKKTKKHNQKRKINKKKITKKNKKNVRKMTRKNKQKK